MGVRKQRPRVNPEPSESYKEEEEVGTPGTRSGRFSMSRSIKVLTNFLLPEAIKEEQKINELVEDRTIRMKSALSLLKERRMRKEKLASAVMYIVFVLIYFGIILEQRKIQESFSLEFALADQVTAQEDDSGNTFYDLQDIDQMWNWIETAFLPGILDPDPKWYNGARMDGDEAGYFMYYNRMIGGVKIGLRRVDPCACQSDYADEKYDHDTLRHGASTGFCSFQCSDRFHSFYPVLYPPYSNNYRSHQDFGPSYDSTKYTHESDVYGGGYFIYMSDDPVLTTKVFGEIKSDQFIDKTARIFEITFNVFNGNYQLFTSVILQFTFAPTGLMDKTVRFGTFPIEPYLTAEDKARAGLEIVFVIFVLFSLGDLVYDVFKEVTGKAATPRCKTFWFFMDVGRNGLFLTSIIQWILIVTDPIALDMGLPLAESNVFYDLEPLLNKHAQATAVHAFCVIVCLLGCFKYFHYSPKYGILVRTISRALPDLLQFMYMFITVFMVFAVMGMMMFGHVLKEWSSFFLSLQTLIMMLTVEYGMSALVGVDAYMGTVFYFFFLVIAYFLLVNILLAILIDAYTALNEENHRIFELEQDTLNVQIPREICVQNWFKIVNFFKKIFRIKLPDEASFLTIEDYIDMLEHTPGLASDAILEELRPTVMNPNPEPELVLTYDVLLKHFSKRHARLMMAALGSPIPKEQWEEQRKNSHVNKMQAARAELASVNAFQEILEETREKYNTPTPNRSILTGVVEEPTTLETADIVVQDVPTSQLSRQECTGDMSQHKSNSWSNVRQITKSATKHIQGVVERVSPPSSSGLQTGRISNVGLNSQKEMEAERHVYDHNDIAILKLNSTNLMEENQALKAEVKELNLKMDSLSDMMRALIRSEAKRSSHLFANSGNSYDGSTNPNAGTVVDTFTE